MDKKNIEQKFSEWYQKVNMNPTPKQLDARFNSIYDYADSDDLNVQALIKFFFKLPCKDDEKDPFIAAIFNNDKTFLLNNTRELECMAGMTMYYLLENNTVNVNKIILHVLSLSMTNIDVVLPDFIVYIKEKMQNITANYREKKLPKMSALKNTGYSNLSEVLKNNEDNEDSEAIKMIFNVIIKIIDNLKTLHKNEMDLYDIIITYKEDSSILAWIVGEYSNDLNKPIKEEISSKTMAIILGKELADLVTFPLGPYAAKAFLNKMLQLCKKDDNTYSLQDMVNVTPRDWRLRFIKNMGNIDIFTPIIFAISKSLEVEDDNDWMPVYSSKYKFNVETIKMKTLEWAYQIYLECLLSKLIY